MQLHEHWTLQARRPFEWPMAIFVPIQRRDEHVHRRRMTPTANCEGTLCCAVHRLILAHTLASAGLSVRIYYGILSETIRFLFKCQDNSTRYSCPVTTCIVADVEIFAVARKSR